MIQLGLVRTPEVMVRNYLNSGGTFLIGAANSSWVARSTGLEITVVDAGAPVKQASPRHRRAGRMGREVNPPPQFGQTLPSTSATQVRQKVHSKEQILASRDSGGKELPQFSQVGRISSTGYFIDMAVIITSTWTSWWSVGDTSRRLLLMQIPTRKRPSRDR